MEIRFAGSVEDRLLQKIVDRLSRNYTNRQPIQSFNIALDISGSHQIQQSPTGYRLASDDQTSVAIVNPASLAAASLAPYPGWGVFRERLQAVLETWNAIAPRYDIQRVGVRTINRIDIPQESAAAIKLDDYIAFRPEVDAITSRPLTGYFVQATLPTVVDHWSATINSTMLMPPPLLQHRSILLDIDVFRMEQIPMNVKELWPIIEQARGIKNDLFERCITEKTRELFK